MSQRMKSREATQSESCVCVAPSGVGVGGEGVEGVVEGLRVGEGEVVHLRDVVRLGQLVPLLLDRSPAHHQSIALHNHVEA